MFKTKPLLFGGGVRWLIQGCKTPLNDLDYSFKCPKFQDEVECYDFIRKEYKCQLSSWGKNVVCIIVILPSGNSILDLTN